MLAWDDPYQEFAYYICVWGWGLFGFGWGSRDPNLSQRVGERVNEWCVSKMSKVCPLLSLGSKGIIPQKKKRLPKFEPSFEFLLLVGVVLETILIVPAV